MIVVYRCWTCENKWKFDGHPMTWGRYMTHKRCCGRRVRLDSWGWDE